MKKGDKIASASRTIASCERICCGGGIIGATIPPTGITPPGNIGTSCTGRWYWGLAEARGASLFGCTACIPSLLLLTTGVPSLLALVTGTSTSSLPDLVTGARIPSLLILVTFALTPSLPPLLLIVLTRAPSEVDLAMLITGLLADVLGSAADEALSPEREMRTGSFPPLAEGPVPFPRPILLPNGVGAGLPRGRDMLPKAL
mmetsp:Transcript_15296/g.38644  ORF Transcript_15296/g.38644 Transcript_15296/m.38644 type:complete len:202 (-) Transcript_15296:1694-2299(-)